MILVFCFRLRVFSFSILESIRGSSFLFWVSRFFFLVYALLVITSLTIFTFFLFQEDRTHNDVGEERIFQRTEYETQVGTV